MLVDENYKQLLADHLTLMTDYQLSLIKLSGKAAERHRQIAAECDTAHLPILAREHDYVAKLLTEKLIMQIRAFRDTALTAADPKSEPPDSWSPHPTEQ